MNATLVKKSFFGIDQYLPYVILGMSAINFLDKLMFILNGPLFSAILLPSVLISMTLSAVGVLGFFLILKGKKIGEHLQLFWCLTQIILFTYHPFLLIDLEQAFSAIVFNSYSESVRNGVIEESVNIGLNLLGVFLTVIASNRTGNLGYYKKFTFSNQAEVSFDSKIDKVFRMQNDCRLLLLTDRKQGKCLVVKMEGKGKFWDFEPLMKYSIYKVDSSNLKTNTLDFGSAESFGAVSVSPIS